jgi:hypothetical protein
MVIPLEWFSDWYTDRKVAAFLSVYQRFFIVCLVTLLDFDDRAWNVR